MDKGLYVYIALCKDNSYYVGVTNNVEKRISQHNSGEDSSTYTFYRRPIKLVWQNKFSNNLEAIKLDTVWIFSPSTITNKSYVPETR